MVNKATAGGAADGPESSDIWRYPVIGIVVIRVLQSDGKKMLKIEYLVPGPDGSVVSEFNVGRQDEVVAVLPAPPDSYRIQRGSKVLGYQFGDASHPDWEKMQ
ncbi:MAG: hypothetical protein LUO79_05295 [Methanomassiliicoccales archaeon]|nr:hypothetical protein [Methanomassiliicoccales archaeon]